MKTDDKKKKIASKMHTYQDNSGKKHSVDLASLKRERGVSAKGIEKLKATFGNKKGKESLEIPYSKTGKNEGNKFYEGKNENNRS